MCPPTNVPTNTWPGYARLHARQPVLLPGPIVESYPRVSYPAYPNPTVPNYYGIVVVGVIYPFHEHLNRTYSIPVVSSPAICTDVSPKVECSNETCVFGAQYSLSEQYSFPVESIPHHPHFT